MQPAHRRSLVRLGASVAVLVLLWWILRKPEPEAMRPEPSRPEESSVEGSEPFRARGSPLADGLHAPWGDGRGDARIVMDLLRLHRERFGAFPTGEDNAAVVRILAGANPAGFVILPRAHRAVSASGELLDRWGTPFFFHMIAHDHVEVRSAGPDRELYTADDVVEASRPF